MSLLSLGSCRLPSLSGKHDGRKILLPVALLRSRNPADLTHIRCTALLDTGATTSALSPDIISKLGLRSHERRLLIVATEERLVEYFAFRIGLFADDAGAESLPFVFAETEGFGMRLATDFDAIIGMDVLRQCDLRIDRTGRWQLQFG